MKRNTNVDFIDQMARIYSTKVSSRGWPFQMLYNDVLDLAEINAYIVNKEVTAKKYIDVNIL